MENVIDSFTGEYAFLSNFYEVPVRYKGLLYQNSEAAFQAQKTVNDAERVQFTTLSPLEAKKLGRHIKLRRDWEDIKIKEMYSICFEKFTQNHELHEKLIATEKKELIEGNTWGDRIWGKVNGEGANHLGKILMDIREKIQE